MCRRPTTSSRHRSPGGTIVAIAGAIGMVAGFVSESDFTGMRNEDHRRFDTSIAARPSYEIGKFSKHRMWAGNLKSLTRATRIVWRGDRRPLKCSKARGCLCLLENLWDQVGLTERSIRHDLFGMIAFGHDVLAHFHVGTTEAIGGMPSTSTSKSCSMKVRFRSARHTFFQPSLR